jgi:hypothetical protein
MWFLSIGIFFKSLSLGMFLNECDPYHVIFYKLVSKSKLKKHVFSGQMVLPLEMVFMGGPSSPIILQFAGKRLASHEKTLVACLTTKN